ncbi:L-serine ammonia-lyase, iron-sulfur-dependent, subunit alpha [Thermophilibacter sp. ET337]|uniref:L-cysteine desulfidase family protein n=1 Tax=Thermophilibacter sp. ET337 TaxID=2973084 RepID=UPI0021AD1CF3|nr:L-serine ammonia-lyase, iron-sulfur-dependent, subunit alpha [Thermophilibacter sp. ET337]MCR8907871.1 L-serine ammonia-lyase, iron-sulfur-dependent, subunit alpha [Thermophilibacter sp. ET337]
MDQESYDAYVAILEEELVCAMGCTEPIAVAYCAALARQTLGELPERVDVAASANIIKNVKSVVVPNTGGARGIEAAAAVGVVAGDAEAKLEVLAGITGGEIEEMRAYLAEHEVSVTPSERPWIFDIQVRVSSGCHTAFCEIAGAHTNVIRVERDGEVLLSEPFEEGAGEKDAGTDRDCLSIEKIVQFADEVNLDDVKQVLGRQIACNTAIAQEGLRGSWGAGIGKVLLEAYGDGVANRAKAWAAAGSDARMGGCELPVVINSGSGNQGLTASVPVIVYAQELDVSHEELLRALVVSNLVTIHLKTGIGRLSAYCGATSAGAGAAAGITYLYGGRADEIAHTVVNAIAIDSGMVCDGAKASCAAKIASAVEAGLLGMQMQRQGKQFFGGDGIVVKGVENTIRNVGVLAAQGMRETDRTIIELMCGSGAC